MLYIEFIKSTGARETGDTFQQYQAIEKIYNDCESMTKDDAYRLWKQTYGKQAKIDRNRILKDIRDMSEYRNHNGIATAREMEVSRHLFQIGLSLTEMNEFRAGYDVHFTNPDGVTFGMSRYHTVNNHDFYEMWIRYEGQTYETAMRYKFGDLKICGA